VKSIKTEIRRTKLDVKVGSVGEIVNDVYNEVPSSYCAATDVVDQEGNLFTYFHFSHKPCRSEYFHETKCICITVKKGFVVSISKHKPHRPYTKCRKDYIKTVEQRLSNYEDSRRLYQNFGV